MILSIFLFVWYLLELRSRDEMACLYPASLLDTGEILVLGIFWQYAVDLLLLFLAKIRPEQYQMYMDHLAESGKFEITFGVLLSSVVFVPVFEELLYRGVLFRKLWDHLPFAWCNVIQSAIFGLMHGNPVQAAIAFLLGLLLGWMAEYYQSIFPSVFLHMVINLFGWMNGALQIGNFQKGIMAAASGAVILAMSLGREGKEEKRTDRHLSWNDRSAENKKSRKSDSN
ncbi:MAG: lysostaphin resistance A-like protein [Fusicatenibacter sp.]